MVAGLPKSRRSGGPKTAAGKLAASRNSLKSGVYSTQEILPGEDPTHFQNLKEQFVNYLHPQGATEDILVYSLVVIAWKKLRLQNLESRIIAEKLAQPITISKLGILGITQYPAGAGQYLIDSQEIASMDAEQLIEERTTLEGLQGERWNEEVLVQLQQQSPSLFIKLQAGMLAETNYSKISLFDMATLRYTNVNPKRVIETVIDDLLTKVKAMQWVADHKDKILAAHQAIYDKRLAGALQFDRQRSFDDLDRSFFKNLNELRKQQAWRKDQERADMEPKGS